MSHKDKTYFFSKNNYFTNKLIINCLKKTLAYLVTNNYSFSLAKVRLFLIMDTFFDFSGRF